MGDRNQELGVEEVVSWPQEVSGRHGDGELLGKQVQRMGQRKPQD